MDEYYLKNDLLNYVDSIIYDENSTKRIDRLLLFRLDLNTHSTTVRIKNKLLIIRNYKLEQKKKILPEKNCILYIPIKYNLCLCECFVSNDV